MNDSDLNLSSILPADAASTTEPPADEGTTPPVAITETAPVDDSEGVVATIVSGLVPPSYVVIESEAQFEERKLPQPTRFLSSHSVNMETEPISVGVLDELHDYLITYPVGDEGNVQGVVIEFQKGPIGEVGVNGISNETLLAIVEDRLDGFQRTPFACTENANALVAIRQALANLHQRTRSRMARGVEGTNAQ